MTRRIAPLLIVLAGVVTLTVAVLTSLTAGASTQPVCNTAQATCIPWRTIPPGASHGPGFSCKIIKGVPTVTFWNPTNHPMEGTVNGVTKTAPAGGKATWTVQSGDVIVQVGARGPKVKCPCGPTTPTTTTSTAPTTIPPSTPPTTAVGTRPPATLRPGPVSTLPATL